MRVGAAPCVGLDQPDRVVHPRPWLAPSRACCCAHLVHRSSSGAAAYRIDTLGWDWPSRAPASRPPIGAATSVSSVASGRQQNRTGAYGDVPMPAETCSCVRAPHCDAPLARERSRSQLVTTRAVERQAQLAAVGVTGHHQLIAVGGEAIKHPRLWRMGQSQGQVGHDAGRPRDGFVAVARQVRVVDTRGGDLQARHFEFAAVVRHVQPAALGERRPQVLPWQRFPVDAVAGIGQVIQRVLRSRTEVVVAAEHENAGHRKQITERLHYGRHSLRMGQVVAGVDDEVRLQAGQLAQPGLLAPLRGPHVDIADVQHLQRRRPGTEHRHRHLTHGERIAFDE